MERPSPGSPIFIEIAGRRLQIRYPLRALKRMEAEAGVSIFKDMQRAFSSADKFATLLYYGLVTHQPDITQEWIEDNMELATFASISPYLTYAMSGVWPESAPSPNGAAPRMETAEEAGSISGRADDTTSDSASATSGA